ncbi:NAD-dependent epimerase/dehydratase family protein [Kitasatospora sp. LaBMicrA B282]|uniref:NAD-dependent epimerase/dehydratase family protein n=1 Tax=Kitasatospora sp. LaBMicrA B282 TaxID=3420949 RepID=UPI003D0FF2A4
MRVVITGGADFIGANLASELLDAAFTGADAVVHPAALPPVAGSVADPLGSHPVNATGTLHVLAAARRAGARRLDAASSAAVSGADQAPAGAERRAWRGARATAAGGAHGAQPRRRRRVGCRRRPAAGALPDLAPVPLRAGQSRTEAWRTQP